MFFGAFNFLLFTYLLVLGEEVRDLAGVEHVVEVLEHGLHHDLSVGEKECHVLAFHACFDLRSPHHFVCGGRCRRCRR